MGCKVKYINNCETGEVIVRELTDDEIELEAEQAKVYQAKLIKIEADKAEAAAQKAALLDRLGITEAEAKLLIG